MGMRLPYSLVAAADQPLPAIDGLTWLTRPTYQQQLYSQPSSQGQPDGCADHRSGRTIVYRSVKRLSHGQAGGRMY